MTVVDIDDGRGSLLKTYHIDLRGLNYSPSEAEYIDEAMKRAREDKIATEEELDRLRAAIRAVDAK